MDNLKEYNTFLETYKLSIMNQEETDYAHTPFPSSEIDFLIKKKKSRREIKMIK